MSSDLADDEQGEDVTRVGGSLLILHVLKELLDDAWSLLVPGDSESSRALGQRVIGLLVQLLSLRDRSNEQGEQLAVAQTRYVSLHQGLEELEH